jgi:hypothetical protein
VLLNGVILSKSGYFRGEEVVAFYTDENQRRSGFDSMKLLSSTSIV